MIFASSSYKYDFYINGMEINVFKKAPQKFSLESLY